MRLRIRIAVVSGVLLLGAGGAMLFRKDAAIRNGFSNTAEPIPASQSREDRTAANDQQSTHRAPSGSQSDPRAATAATAASPRAEVRATRSSPEPTAGYAAADAPLPAGKADRPAETRSNPSPTGPLWATPDYPRTRTPDAPSWLDDALKADAPGVSSPGNSSAPAIAPSTNWPADVPIASASEPRPRTHTIRDGDTLPLLALRYLDDADRQFEIYDLNRDLLPSPDLLPIGTTITLPKRAPPVARAPAPRQEVETFKMVPVPPGALRGGQPATP